MGLSFWGVLNFLCFNGVAALATVSHVRGAHIDYRLCVCGYAPRSCDRCAC